MTTDREAFEERVGASLDALYDGADLLTGQAQRAENLVLSVVVDAARAYPSEGRIEDFRVWMLGRLVRHYLEYADETGYAEARAAAWTEVGGDGSEPPHADPALVRSDLVEKLESLEETEPDRLSGLIRDCMRRLPLRERSAVWLVSVMELSYGEAARALDVPLSEIRELLYRARRELQLRVALALRGEDDRDAVSGAEGGLG